MNDWYIKKYSASKIVNRIIQLRRQMLVHSYIYYVLNDNIIDDFEWQFRANELRDMQKKYTWKVNFYDEIFKDWDGSTGYHLPKTPEIQNVAERLLRYRDERRAINS